ncbi:Na+/H+ antiporter [Paenibacillus spiritus]|uniref:Na+/H+ antiporter n=1 Tax=Paenibacillus spiritus TaxID=2496557 RepID=A0A5J5G8M8_9BACL|nr:Na+/H+ antiporter [Paenibacillus spiritus]KAA9003962.1 Na+/H+ antiporter [Paenibacillus spiritus]
METLIAVLVLLSLIALSNILNRFIPFVPVPVIQIVLGAAAAVWPGGIHLTLEPELFFVLFIAPLLFNDGRRTPRDELWKLRAPILMLALGLVFITVLAGGYAIHWMIPSIPLAAAFALAAILSPTDAVATSALAGRVHLPGSIHRILEGESLMNDASGLVAFKFAIAAAVTGVFSLPRAIGSFFLIAAGGLIAGAVLAWLLIRLSVFIRRLGMEDVTIHMLLQMLAPFLIYLISEEIGVSGILAVVAGGMIYAVEKDRAVAPQYKLQLVSASTWSVLLFILNGLVFLLLGLSLPDVFSVIFRDTAIDNLRVIGYVFAITALLIAIRLLWLIISAASGLFFSPGEKPGWKPLLLTAVSGVRGAVTLAGAFSIPLTLGDHSPFPERDLILFLAAGVILVSLLTASILLPLLADEQEEKSSERSAIGRITETGLSRLRDLAAASGTDALPAVRQFAEGARELALEHEHASPDGREHELRRQIAEARLTGLRAERRALEHLVASGEVPEQAGRRLLEMLDRWETFFTGRLNSQLRLSAGEVGRLLATMFSGWRSGSAEGRKPDWNSDEAENLCRARAVMIRAAVAALEERRNGGNDAVYGRAAARYRQMLARLERNEETDPSGLAEDRALELKLEAIQEQRNEVQTMYQDGVISRRTAGKLRKFVDELETYIWEN